MVNINRLAFGVRSVVKLEAIIKDRSSITSGRVIYNDWQLPYLLPTVRTVIIKDCYVVGLASPGKTWHLIAFACLSEELSGSFFGVFFAPFPKEGTLNCST